MTGRRVTDNDTPAPIPVGIVPTTTSGLPFMPIRPDPTENVKALTEAAVQRLDDLREKDASHLKELVVLRAEYDAKLRDAESKRIDAIRAVDVGAVNRAAEVSATQALTLATQVATSADTLRIQVATTATAFDAKLAAALEPISKDIADLRRAQYEAQGQKTQVVDSRSNNNFLVGAIGLAITITGAIIAFAIKTTGGG